MANTTCDENNITECHTPGAWMAMLEDSIKQNRLNVTFFFASWSARSKVMYDTLVQAYKSYPEVMFCKVSVDLSEDIPKRIGVRAVPTSILFANGKEVVRLKSVVSFDVLEQNILLHIPKLTK